MERTLADIGYAFTEHSENVVVERKLELNWILQTLESPDRLDAMPDGTIHHLKRITDSNQKVLRVVVNPATFPKAVVTLFFDRRVRYSL